MLLVAIYELGDLEVEIYLHSDPTTYTQYSVMYAMNAISLPTVQVLNPIFINKKIEELGRGYVRDSYLEAALKKEYLVAPYQYVLAKLKNEL